MRCYSTVSLLIPPKRSSVWTPSAEQINSLWLINYPGWRRVFFAPFQFVSRVIIGLVKKREAGNIIWLCPPAKGGATRHPSTSLLCWETKCKASSTRLAVVWACQKNQARFAYTASVDANSFNFFVDFLILLSYYFLGFTMNYELWTMNRITRGRLGFDGGSGKR